MMDLPRIFITEKGERHAKAGHPWVFEGEVVRADGEPADGELVHVFSPKERFLGTGYYNSASKIRVRLISRNANDKFDAAFYERRIRYALDYRRTVMGDDFRASRLIFGEADQFPGLTVDLFEDILVAQTLCLGTEKIKDLLFETLVRVLPEYGVTVRRIYERCDAAVRKLEGMEPFCGYWKPERFAGEADGHVLMTENGLRYDVDYVNGQKTGFFLDQKYNRRAAAKLAAGRRVLDCFTHTGAFALNCAAAGAAHVTAVDISESAIEQTKKNAALNGLEGKMSFICADVFRLLTDMANEKRHDYDCIILDPPAFTKSGATVRDAYRGYKDINLRAMRCLPRGGYLATCSCSHFMKTDLFEKMLDDAACDAGVSLRQIERRAQSPDHPILRNVPETDYLKFYLFQVV
ncbi:MAG: class I SAM-dependent rRNA methyltransferase [Eubacteriales bacterium]